MLGIRSRHRHYELRSLTGLSSRIAAVMTSMAKKLTSGRDIVRDLFLKNLGKIVTKEQIIKAICTGLGVDDYENWHQRLSELRVNEGYTILSGRDRHTLKNGQYLMETEDRRSIAGKRVAPRPETWKAVLKRADNRCEWKEAGQKCGLQHGDLDPVGGGTVRLSADHMRPHSIDPNSDPRDPKQWQALCGRHQVTKRNYWDSTTGKLNAMAIVQAASSLEKNAIFSMLLDYHGYTRDSHGRISKK